MSRRMFFVAVRRVGLAVVTAGLVAGCGGAANLDVPADQFAAKLDSNPATLPYGPDTCQSGYVWREARATDHVCVVPPERDKVAAENANPTANRQPGGGAYGPDTCASGFVWREAFDGDTICVTPDRRTQVKADNAAAAGRRATEAPPPPPPVDPCKPRDGVGDGERFRHDPTLYGFTGGRPWVGARWEPCARKVTVYFEQNLAHSHYNLRINGGGQAEISVRNESGVQSWVTPDGGFGNGTNTIAMQSCERGGVFESSKCTGWSSVRLEVSR